MWEKLRQVNWGPWIVAGIALYGWQTFDDYRTKSNLKPIKAEEFTERDLREWNKKAKAIANAKSKTEGNEKAE